MVQWFHGNYEDPAVRTPYESAEGGYQWIWGGPYDAHEQIGSEFSDVADDDIIESASSEVTSDGLFDWAPTARPEDYENNDEPDDGIYSIDEPLPDISEFDPPEEDADYLVDEEGNYLTDAAGNRLVVSRERPDYRAELLSRLVRLEDVVKSYADSLPPRNHNNPPELVEPEPITVEQIKQITEASAALRRETASGKPDPAVVQTQANTLRKIGSAIAGAVRFIAGGIVQNAAWAAVVAIAANPKQVYDAVMAVANMAHQWAQHLIGLF